MVLLTLLQKYRSKLYEKYVDASDLEALEEVINSCIASQDVLENLLGAEVDDFSFFDRININSLLFILRKGNKDLDIKSLKESLRQLKIVYDAITKKGLKMDYTIEQIQFVRNLRRLANSQLIILKEQWHEASKELNVKRAQFNNNGDLEEKIIICEDLIDKIENPNDLGFITEFDTINALITGRISSPDEIRKALLEIEKYNDTIEREHRKPNISSFNIEDFVRFMDLKGHNKKEYSSYLDEISKYGDIDNIMSVYITLEQLQLVDKFSFRDLLTILLYSNKDKVLSTCEQLKDSDIAKQYIYTLPSVFVVSETEENNKNVRRGKSAKRKKEVANLYQNAHKVSLSTIIKNKEELSTLGYEIPHNLKGFQKVLQTASFRIKRNLHHCSLYGIFDEEKKLLPPPTTLVSYDLMDTFDMFIELGLEDYIRNNNSRLVEYDSALFTRLFITRIKEGINFRDKVFTNRGIKNEYSSSNGLNVTMDNYQDVLELNGVVKLPDSQYDEIIRTSEPDEISPELFKESYIKKLEDGFKVSEFSYQIGSQIISRLKVLRVLETLKKQHDYNAPEALLYALTYRSILDSKTYDEIKNMTLYLTDSPNFKGIMGLG